MANSGELVVDSAPYFKVTLWTVLEGDSEIKSCNTELQDMGFHETLRKGQN